MSRFPSRDSSVSGFDLGWGRGVRLVFLLLAALAALAALAMGA
jgi:hypothetical protein